MTTPQTIIITGASRGLGAAAAQDAAKLGANVILNARSADALEAMAQAIKDAGGKALAVPGDVSRAEDCQFLVKRTVEKFGRIDALVNNAGAIEPIAPIGEVDPTAWEKNLAVNLFGPMMLTQIALPYLRQSKGRVINVSSGASLRAIPGWSAYCAAKGALNQFNRSLALEEELITAVAFRPGVIDTDMQAAIRRQGSAGMTAEAHASFVALYEKGELMPPEVPGGALSILSLYAPREWSGEFISWGDERLQKLVIEYGTG